MKFPSSSVSFAVTTMLQLQELRGATADPSGSSYLRGLGRDISSSYITNNIRELETATTDIVLDVETTSPVDDNIIISIVEDHCCDAPWITFTGGENDAYAAISNYVLGGQGDDVRAQYGPQYQDAQTWINYLNNQISMDNVAAQVNNTCNSTCFDTVSNQLNNEFIILGQLNQWNLASNHLNDRIAYVMHSALTFAYNNMIISSQQQKVPNPSKFETWFTPILNLVTLASQFLGPMGAPINVANMVVLSAKTAQYVNGVVTSQGKSTSTGSTDFTQNDMVDLTYAYLYENVTGTYSNMDAVAGNQATAIASNWGRLQSFNQDVYAKGVVPSDSSTDDYLNNNTAMYEWQAFEWLFSSKYELCINQDYGFGSCTSDDVSTKVKKSNGDAQCEFITPNPRGPTYPPIITWESKPVYTYTWLCDETNSKNTLPTALMNTLNSNTYANSQGLVKNGNFAMTVLDACNDSTATSCTGTPNITLAIHYLGECANGSEEGTPATCKSIPR